MIRISYVKRYLPSKAEDWLGNGVYGVLLISMPTCLREPGPQSIPYDDWLREAEKVISTLDRLLNT